MSLIVISLWLSRIIVNVGNAVSVVLHLNNYHIASSGLDLVSLCSPKTEVLHSFAHCVHFQLFALEMWRHQ